MPSGSPGLPPVVERLTLSTDSDGLASVRMTEGPRSSRTSFHLPDQNMLDSYEDAIWDTGNLPQSSEAAEHHSEKLRVLSEALAMVVPTETRKRVENANGLAVIEVTVDTALEKYPWELIAGPGGLGYAGDVVVYRRARASFKPKRWSSAVLLTGSEAMTSGSAYARDELVLITESLKEISAVAVHCEPHLVIGALRGLLDRHQPAVFHLAAHGTRDSLQIQNERRPTMEDLSISPKVLADELESSQVKAAVLSCCDSATPQSSGDRPAACQIAERTDAAVIGMAGKIHPGAAAAFGKTFHTGLASGKSAAEAYFQSVRAIQGLSKHGLMWSMPVMYSRDANVILFPSSNASRARLTFQQAEQQLTILDKELAELASMDDCKPSEWTKRASHPAVRVSGITGYLPVMAEAAIEINLARALEAESLKMACDDLSGWLQSSRRTLRQLSSSDNRERNRARTSLRLRRRELERIRMKLQWAFEDIS